MSLIDDAPPLPWSVLTMMLLEFVSGVERRPWMSTVSWKSWPLGGRHADLAGRHRLALLLDDVGHVLRREAEV